jgi:D-cysteine desulfhydrase
VSEPERLTRKIRSELAPCGLGRWPTALDSAPELAWAVGLEALWLKREDQSAPECGGSKVRGLEFLMAGTPPGSVFVTVGGTGSTHCLATAVHAAAVSCRAALAQFPQPETEAARAVAAACDTHAALVVRARTPSTLPLALIAAWRRAARLGPRRWIPGGGAHPRAVVGHLLGGLELASQCAVVPDAIVAPLGTGGTLAGLALAVAQLGWPTRIVGVRVAPRIVGNRWRTLRLARGAARLLSRHGIPFPVPASPLPVDVVNGLGRGYGHPTAEGESARRLASEHGVTLDSTYGAKAFAALERLASRGVHRVVFWHTFGVPSRPPQSAA